MKVLYLTISGHVYTEDIGPSIREIELDDGNHPVTSHSVWRDRSHDSDAIMFVRQGVSAPEGDDASTQVVYETDRLKLQQKKWRASTIGINRMMWRRLSATGWSAFYGVSTIILSLSAYFLLWLFMWIGFRIWLPMPVGGGPP